MAAKYHTPGVDPPKVHFENEQEHPHDIAATTLFDQNADLVRFQSAGNAFIDALEQRRALQDQLAQEQDPARVKSHSEDLRAAERNVETLRASLDDHSVELGERFSNERQAQSYERQAPQLNAALIHESEPNLRANAQQQMNAQSIDQVQSDSPTHDQGLNLAQRMEIAALGNPGPDDRGPSGLKGLNLAQRMEIAAREITDPARQSPSGLDFAQRMEKAELEQRQPIEPPKHEHEHGHER